jgi:hypothetical protein
MERAAIFQILNGKDKLQFRLFLLISLVVCLLMLILINSEVQTYSRFFGPLNPLLIFIGSAVTGLFLFMYLLSSTGLKIYIKRNLNGLLFSSVLALLFGLEIIAADIWIVNYPSTLNVPFPSSIIFYPTIGFVVEIIFHLLPLSLIIIILRVLSKRISYNGVMLIAIILVSIAEPLYQVIIMGMSSQYSPTTLIYTGFHIFLLSLSQLLIFRRYDFISMYTFRLVFYFAWHIIWGNFRLNILF